MSSFTCYLVSRASEGHVSGAISQQPLDALPEGDVLVRVEYSSLNYKDALAATGHPGVARQLPHVPGIDAAGTVTESRSPAFAIGEPVLVTGYDLGAGCWGGWSQVIRVPSPWIVPLPPGMSSREAMLVGTAGLTAAMSVQALQHQDIHPDRGEVVVTGSTGGVGMMSVMLLAKLGYHVVAATGKAQEHDRLRQLGAAEVIDRGAVDDHSDRPLQKARWAGAVDTVGGTTLATLLKTTKAGGLVAACGLVGGAHLHTTVYPFLLRGITLAGIDSAWCPHEQRVALWQRLANGWKLNLSSIGTEVMLDDVPAAVQRILAGQNVGRTLIKIP